MSIKLADQYTNAVAPTDAYPGGSFKNKTAPSATDGTPLEKQWANDIWGFGEAILSAAGVVPSGAPDTAIASDRFNALMQLIRKFGVPAGACEFFGTTLAPDGWLIANGAEVSRSTYADLFAAVGTRFGEGNRTTTFNLPDLRAAFIRGVDNSKGIDAARVLGSTQTDAFQGHKHTNGVGGGAPTVVTGTFGIGTGTTGNPINDGTNGVPRTATETRPYNIALLGCIKY